MRICIAYPPILKNGRYPLLGQNRQFRYSSSEAVRIYPIVPATAATILHQDGYDVLFLDGINKRLSPESFKEKLDAFNPDLLVMETKTPIIKQHWDYIDKIKKERDIICVLVGDHVSALPEETMRYSSTDYVITGGDHDIGLLSLCRHLSEGVPLCGGIWYRENGQIKNTGEPFLVPDLDELPFIDRELTGWENYGEAYLYKPCSYIMSGRGCGGGPRGVGTCGFCVWQHNFWNCRARLRSPQNVAEEIEQLVNRYRVKEIFDDNEGGAIWNKTWLKQFHSEMDKRGLLGKVMLSTNARADILDAETCKLLKDTGFRLLKVGLESGNNKTLQKLNKKETVEDIKAGVKNAKDSGLIVMLTIMVGYPWETPDDAEKTYQAARELMLYKTKFGDALQASVIVPYPGTPLYDEAIKNGWFITDPHDYEKLDMSQPVLKTHPMPLEWCDRMWGIHKEPAFMAKSMLTLRSLNDLKLAYTGYKSVSGHKEDF